MYTCIKHIRKLKSFLNVSANKTNKQLQVNMSWKQDNNNN